MKAAAKPTVRTTAHGGFLEKAGAHCGPCLHPWADMWISALGRVSCCPENRTVFGSAKDTPLDTLWNSEAAQRVRTLVAEGKYEAAGCDKECPYLRGDFSQPKQAPPAGELINPDFDLGVEGTTHHINVENVAEDYQQRRAVCEGLPLFVDMQPVLRCNLDCVMCGQPHESPLVHDENIRQRVTELREHANYFRWQGGEVFLDREFRRVLLAEVQTAPAHLRLRVITNGTVLNRDLIVALVTGPNPVEFLLSIDGVSREAFEAVRVNGKYDRAIATLETLAELQRDSGTRLVVWNYVVMRTTVNEMDRAIELAEQLGVDLNFAAIQGEHGEENIFCGDEAHRHRHTEEFRRLQATAASCTVSVTGLDGLIARMRNGTQPRDRSASLRVLP